MSQSQVLARKWRPRRFADLVGQEHVVRALSNALERGRLHHAYLFTGTRGVGKTTLARILARCLNCETGVTATPCGQCAACQQIETGRFVDLIEIDAASYTGVDNMREILENAQYAPTAGRYKVYIIDEVHMLSKNAFNAMLKTLEEPPGHVVFILATTDPQKVPVTVLSRCLQFNLRQMTPELTASHLQQILEAEAVAFEPGALNLLARAASGSMRDALSLTDQAIAYGQGVLRVDETQAMLGVADSAWLFPLLERLAASDGPALMQAAEQLAARSLSFEAALQDMAALFERIALMQVVPDAIASDDPNRAALESLANALDREAVQLYYQIAILARRDIDWAPDPFAGFRMALLRMLAFTPSAEIAPRTVTPKTSSAQHPAPPATSPAPSRAAATPGASATFNGDWFALSQRLGGGIKQLASVCEMTAYDAQSITLRLPEAARTLHGSFGERLALALREMLGAGFRVQFEFGTTQGAAPAEIIAREKGERRAAAEAAIQTDPVVQGVMHAFDATVHDISPI
jgi:DNA polymerase-3 subunit gamma/tau